MPKILHIKNATVAAVNLEGEAIGTTYGDLVEVPNDTEVGVGDPWPQVKAEAVKAPEAPKAVKEPKATKPAEKAVDVKAPEAPKATEA